jgi:hypothetical protein
MAALKPPPLRTPMVDKNGLPTPEWAAFLRDFYARAGGLQAQPQSQVLGLIEALQDRCTALEAETDGLGVGRQL